jgi:hypothetical protein
LLLTSFTLRIEEIRGAMSTLRTILAFHLGF